jgi:hypothetical protein
MSSTPLHGVWERAWESRETAANPWAEVTLQVRFTAPSGITQTVRAFWDGDTTWRVRFSPTEVGIWSWATECSNPRDTGLHGQSGTFTCVPYDGTNPLYRHGPLLLAPTRRYFVHADGTPFLWLGDTAWNGVLRATLPDWEYYLHTRAQQGFTAVQFVTTHWRALPADAHGEQAYKASNPICINPAFFQRLDEKVAAINRYGLVAVPVLLWALREPSPGATLSAEDATLLARYLVARWGAHQVVWILAGGGDYRGERAAHWQQIGRAVFLERHDRLVTMHLPGLHWLSEPLVGETWLDFIGYQSGHDDSDEYLRWLVAGPPAQHWRQEPPRPIINLEPCYESHQAYHSKQIITGRTVRRALYWSMLVAPTTGVTYGQHGVWHWSAQRETPIGHPYLNEVTPWREALHLEGAQAMTHLRAFFAALPWWRLRPAPELVPEQPGQADPRRFVAAACTEEGDVAVLYVPEGLELTLDTTALRHPALARWFNPRQGTWHPAGPIAHPTARLATPTGEDWALAVQAEGPA